MEHYPPILFFRGGDLQIISDKTKSREDKHKELDESNSYPAAVVPEGTADFTASFQERLIFLSPMNDGEALCSG